MSHDVPSSGEPEYLSSGDPTVPPERRPRSGPRWAFVAGGAIALVGLVGGAVWAWTAYAGTGPQPSEALPADTLGYAAVDLDPSGKQKIEAIRILRKFPAFTDAVDVDTEDDLRERIVDEALAGSDCDLDYGDDFEPWLGQRFGVAALPGDEQPDPVFVLQVTDADGAEEGLDAVAACSGDEEASWEIRGEWAVVAETEDVARDAADAAAEASLADDETFQRWTDAAGDPGIITAYAAPDAGPAVGDLLQQQGLGDAAGLAPEGMAPEGGLSSDLDGAFQDFGGAALTVRFADGALEVEGASAGTEEAGYASEAGADVVSTLPDDTAVAFGIGLEEGWGEAILDRAEDELGPDAEEGVQFFESQLGLDLPDDLETLLGESAAVALGGDFDAQALAQSSDGSDVPIGAKIQGDAEEIADILDKLQAAAGPDGEQVLGTDSEDDVVSVGPNGDYREDLLEDGDLGGNEVYQDVVREADKAAAVLFVNFDAGDWLSDLVREQGDPEAVENVDPLEAAGLSTWLDEEEAHALFRVTTESEE